MPAHDSGQHSLQLRQAHNAAEHLAVPRCGLRVVLGDDVHQGVDCACRVHGRHNHGEPEHQPEPVVAGEHVRLPVVFVEQQRVAEPVLLLHRGGVAEPDDQQLQHHLLGLRRELPEQLHAAPVGHLLLPGLRQPHPQLQPLDHKQRGHTQRDELPHHGHRQLDVPGQPGDAEPRPLDRLLVRYRPQPGVRDHALRRHRARRTPPPRAHWGLHMALPQGRPHQQGDSPVPEGRHQGEGRLIYILFKMRNHSRKKTSVLSSHEATVARLQAELQKQKARTRQLQSQVVSLKQLPPSIPTPRPELSRMLYQIQSLQSRLSTILAQNKAYRQQIQHLRKQNESMSRLVKSLEEDSRQKRDFGEYLLKQNQEMNRDFFKQLAAREQKLREQFKDKKKNRARKSMDQIRQIIRNFSTSSYAK